jgi:hypothetical protein
MWKNFWCDFSGKFPVGILPPLEQSISNLADRIELIQCCFFRACVILFDTEVTLKSILWRIKT